MVYVGWFLTLAILAVFANWPVRTGLPVGFITYQGFPFQFASWTSGELDWYRWGNLFMDIAIWGVVIAFGPWILALRRGDQDIADNSDLA